MSRGRATGRIDEGRPQNATEKARRGGSGERVLPRNGFEIKNEALQHLVVDAPANGPAFLGHEDGRTVSRCSGN